MMQGSTSYPAPQLSPAPPFWPRRIQIGPAEGQSTESSIAQPREPPFLEGGRRKAGGRGACSAGC